MFFTDTWRRCRGQDCRRRSWVWAPAPGLSVLVCWSRSPKTFQDMLLNWWPVVMIYPSSCPVTAGISLVSCDLAQDTQWEMMSQCCSNVHHTDATSTLNHLGTTLTFKVLFYYSLANGQSRLHYKTSDINTDLLKMLKVSGWGKMLESFLKQMFPLHSHQLLTRCPFHNVFATKTPETLMWIERRENIRLVVTSAAIMWCRGHLLQHVCLCPP